MSQNIHADLKKPKYNINCTMQKRVSMSKNNISASNFHMHIFNMSVTFLQSVEKIR